ncbi:hypothetical protein [Thiocystis violascens]|uniref:Uncharacterized protein n=1 Tax=Thiocystis violascens (strain ATCC 17096 / DSM 198 / 6111) TaxID=765911 RepID=I3Y7C6_THIV6|nr:hypothetical protein [Thiocystis violascens]AFL72894.1 hypothetical protein Thivi_0856 [Thiocystis violascens DSM 198]
MNQRKTFALVLTVLGLLLAVAGPFLPGGIHLTPVGPPGAGHVTSLVATDQGDILAGTQAGEVWRLRGGAWTRENLALGGQPVLALLGEPGRTPVGTAAGLFPPAGESPLEDRVGSLLQTELGLLAGTVGGVRLLVNGRWSAPGPVANIYSLSGQRHGDGHWLHAGTIGAGVLSTSAAEAGAAWQPNSQGLPEAVKVFSFATTQGGLLLAGTDQGVFWQSRPGQPWRSLHPALDGRRAMSVHIAADGERQGRERLWIGGDAGLSSLALAEQGETLAAEGDPLLADSAEWQPPFGIGAIVSSGDRLLVSAGAVYEYGPTPLSGWYWISLAGVVLILIAGWIMPRPTGATADPADV